MREVACKVRSWEMRFRDLQAGLESLSTSRSGNLKWYVEHVEDAVAGQYA